MAKQGTKVSTYEGACYCPTHTAERFSEHRSLGAKLVDLALNMALSARLAKFCPGAVHLRTLPESSLETHGFPNKRGILGVPIIRMFNICGSPYWGSPYLSLYQPSRTVELTVKEFPLRLETFNPWGGGVGQELNPKPQTLNPNPPPPKENMIPN